MNFFNLENWQSGEGRVRCLLKNQHLLISDYCASLCEANHCMFAYYAKFHFGGDLQLYILTCIKLASHFKFLL